MKKIQFVLFLLLMLSGVPQAQEYQEVLRNVFYEAEFWMVEEAYPDALLEYQKLYTRGYEDNANINYRMGICYLNIPGEKAKAIPYLEKAVNNVTARYKEGIFKETKAPFDAWLYLGNGYRINNQLDKAIECYNEYKELIDDDESEMAHYADKQIEACNNARKAMENPVFHIRENLGEKLNTGNADYNPVISHDENTLIYMTTLKFYDAVNMVKRENGEWGDPRQITAELEPEGKLYANSFSRDGKTLFLNQEDNFNSDIYVSLLDGERWGKANPLEKEINTKYWESHACISADGETLYLASNRKEGLGGMDIWVSKMGPEGWEEPQNIGETINTDLNEDHPFISEDGSLLFFASQGHFNIGGYDIFYTEKQADGSWGEPRNIGYPLNTTDDDLFFVPLGDGKTGYQAIFSDENVGSRDLYRFQIFDTEEEYLAALAKPEEETPEEPVEEPVEETVTTEETEVLVLPDPEQPTIMYVIRPVFFAFDRYNLSPEAKSTLDDLAEILQVYPALEVQAIGHTDHKGSDSYNMMLSRKRSASVVKYITQKGIDGKRIKSTGVGESQPVARNANPDGSDSPQGRKLNRRVEILVVKPELPNVKVENVKVPDHLKK
jgi:outer membrane protein OmpA-like peptidoglycan-associated protein